MSVFKKLKDVLFDIEEEEIPVISKEEKIPVKVKEKEEDPIKEIKIPKEDFEEIKSIPSFEPEKRETKFNFPLDFEEELPSRSVKNDYFDEDYTRRIDHHESRVKEESRYSAKNKYDYSRSVVKESSNNQNKPFKPSPVISPVYGILDQNYTKDDVIVKSEVNKNITIDEVRKKAYGSKKEEKKEETEPLKTLDELLIDDTTEKLDKKEIENNNIVYDDELPDEPYADEIIENNESNPDDSIESDLFNLIDSMYEEKNEREDLND